LGGAGKKTMGMLAAVLMRSREAGRSDGHSNWVGKLLNKLGELGEAMGKPIAAVDRVGELVNKLGKQWGSRRRRWTELGSW
jgi:hypothetical protein